MYNGATSATPITNFSGRITSTTARAREGRRNHYLSQANNARQVEATTPPKHVIRSVLSRSRLPKRPSVHALRASQSATAMAQSASTTNQNRNPRLSLDQQSLTALPQLPDQAIPQRSSSLRKSTHSQTPPRPDTAKGPNDTRRVSAKSPPPSALPPRPRTQPSESTLPSSRELGKSSSLSSTSPPREQVASTTSPRTPRHVPLAPYDPSPLNPVYHIPSPSSEMSNALPFRPAGSTYSPSSQDNGTSSTRPTSEHVQLPSGFQPGTKVHTDVETIFHPSVTREVLKEHTVKVVQEEISRDIHLHHFYTYVQPVKVVEILPARHFTIDEKTGEKVEIPAPEGWELPSDMRPRKLQFDVRDLKPEYRHYVVDDEHPTGELEPPPPEYPPINAGKRTKNATWSPFPKIAGVA